MNATVTMKEEVRKDSLIGEIPLDKIQESKTNPRTHYDEGALTELAANIKEHGVLQPVLLRLRPNGASKSYELVVGSRRYRASKLARRETIPASIRELAEARSVAPFVLAKSAKWQSRGIRRVILCPAYF
jgi:ParB family transcriptional regulator, chromosome partitioning protein